MNRWELKEEHKKGISIACLIIFLAVAAALTYFVGRPMIRFFSEPEKFREWVDMKGGIGGRVLFILLMTVQVVVALIPGEPLEIGAGYAFGAIEGTLLCVAGITLGSLLVFLFVRRFGIRLVEVFFSQEKIHSLKFLQDSEKLELITFFVFFIPGTPKDLLSYFVGLTDMKLSRWMLIASLARLPSIITSTVGGDALGMKNYQFAIVVFSVTLALSLCGLWVYRGLQKRHAAKKAAKAGRLQKSEGEQTTGRS